MISLIFLLLASICNAVMDNISHHWEKSVFHTDKFDSKWWNPEVSWKNKYEDGDFQKPRVKWFLKINKPVQLTDAWHFFKSLMIIFICVSIVSFTPVYLSFISSYIIVNYLVVLLIYGTIWNTIFSLFYNKLLVKNKKTEE